MISYRLSIVTFALGRTV